MFLFDAHCDTLSAGLDLWSNEGQFDLCRALARGPGAQLMAAYGKDQPGQLDRLAAFQPRVPEGFALLPAVEGGDTVRSIEDMDVFLERGVRCFGLTWNHDNALAGGCLGQGRGLSGLGAAVVALLEERGVYVDLAHASRQSFFEVLETAKRPVLVTHACCGTLHPHPRNLDDDALRALQKNGGVLGINFHSPFLTGKARATMDDVAAHILHALRLMGETQVALGSDFDGGITAPEGLEGTEAVPALLARLSRHLPPSALRAVAGENLARLFFTDTITKS